MHIMCIYVYIKKREIETVIGKLYSGIVDKSFYISVDSSRQTFVNIKENQINFVNTIFFLFFCI